MDESILTLVKELEISPVAAAAIAVVAAIVPRAIASISNWNLRRTEKSYNRYYLEILKLRCEIQSLIQQHTLDTDSFRLPPLPPLPSASVDQFREKEQLKRRYLGSLAGAASTILVLGMYIVFYEQNSIAYLSDVLLGLFLFLILSAAMSTLSFLLPMRRKWHAYLFGLSIPVLLFSITALAH